MASKSQLELKNLVSTKALDNVLNENKELRGKLETQNSNKNYDFIQVSRNPGIGNLWILADNPKAMKVYLFMAAIANYNSNAVLVDKEELRQIMNTTVRTVERAIRTLKELGFIDVIKRKQATIYILNPKITWAAKNSQRQYCQYEGIVGVCPSKQKEMDSINNKFVEIKKNLACTDF